MSEERFYTGTFLCTIDGCSVDEYGSNNNNTKGGFCTREAAELWGEKTLMRRYRDDMTEILENFQSVTLIRSMEEKQTIVELQEFVELYRQANIADNEVVILNVSDMNDFTTTAKTMYRMIEEWTDNIQFSEGYSLWFAIKGEHSIRIERENTFFLCLRNHIAENGFLKERDAKMFLDREDEQSFCKLLECHTSQIEVELTEELRKVVPETVSIQTRKRKNRQYGPSVVLAPSTFLQKFKNVSGVCRVTLSNNEDYNLSKGLAKQLCILLSTDKQWKRSDCLALWKAINSNNMSFVQRIGPHDFIL